MALPLPLTSPERAQAYRRSGLWSDVTVAERVFTAASSNPDKIAVRVAGEAYSYRPLKETILRVAGGLSALGLPPGSVVAGQLPNGVEIPILHLACNLILRGGRNVSPAAIEENLILHPSVAEVAVAPMPDPVLGERACAFVVLKPGADLTLQQAVQFLIERDLAIWQLPERLELIAELPRSARGKTLKTSLTAQVTEALRREGVIA
jgi:non-ribosomal peptide synthetase component E (peptide arylation enzyme)